MKSSAAFYVAAALLSSLISPASALWPQPTEITTGTTTLKLAEEFEIDLSGIQDVPEDLQKAVERTTELLGKDKLEILVPDRGASYSGDIDAAPALKKLKLSLSSSNGTVRSISEEATAHLEDRVEGYTLDIPEDGSDATLTADSTLGLFRGLTTFGQVWYDLDGKSYSVEAPFAISDSPAYPYRGFMLDTSRNYFPIADIKRTLDAMSWVKLSTFHWHVVDSQSFPLEVPGYEEISEAGAYSKKMKYSAEDVADVIAYAAERGIDVLPEFDSPGHTSIIYKSHPEHIAGFVNSPWGTYAAEPPSGQIRISNSTSRQFGADVTSAISKMFPGNYFSTGGDEVNAALYEDDEQTQAELTASGETIEQALDEYIKVAHGVLHDANKTAVVWQEMVLDHNVTLKDDTLVLAWISSEDAAAVAKKGHKVVHAPSDFFYLDCGLGGWVGANPLGNSWCDPFKTWQKIYSFDPLANITEAERPLVMGGQTLVWAEQTSTHNLDPQIWPRAASAAEVFWTGPGGNVTTALPRLHDVAFRMNERGVGAIALQPLWCALRPGLCDLTA